MPAYYTLKNQVPLYGGATLGFTEGKGYYAKPRAGAKPGDAAWAQAPEYGWTGSGDRSVVTQATQGPMTTPTVEGGDYSGPGGMDFGGPVAPYTGASSSLLQSQSTEELGSQASTMTSKIRQALVDLGLTDRAQLNADAAKYVDDPTWEAAKANKYSLFQKLADQERKATAQSRAELAARGMLSSGQLTKSAQDILKQVEEQRYGGVREFSGGVGELLSGYAAKQREWAARIADARFQEAQYQQQVQAASGGGGGGGAYLGTGVGRPGEWADLPVSEGWEPWRNTDARYDMTNATRTDYGYIGPQGQRYDENGRVI